MVDDQVPQLTGPHGQSKAREILDGMSEHRIDPKRIKTTETAPRARGGQGTVTLGTMILPQETASWVPEQLLKAFLERKLAIKKLEWNRQDAEASAKFLKSIVIVNEISIMASISHPNIVKFIGFVEDVSKGDAWIISPWEANGNLREFLQSGKWEIPERVSLVQDVINGVEYLHTREPPICHGDLKSLNILVNSSYQAVITDFGSARTKQSVGALTENSTPELPHQPAIDIMAQDSTSPKIKLNSSTLELTLTGPGFSLRWTAPEVLNNGVQDLPSDMWAIGWICWEIFTGRIPFEGLNFQGAIISHVIKGTLPAIREEADLSHILELCGLMSDCWISNPVKRVDASTFRRKARWVPSTRPSAHTSGGAKLRSAALLQELGTMYRLQDNTVMAESHYRSAIDIATQTKDDRAKANALDGLGEIYRAQSRYHESERALREAHEIHSRIGDSLGAANALNGLENIYRAQLRNSEAENVLKEAREIHSQIGNDLGTANTLVGLGHTYRRQARNMEAEKVFMEAHEIFSRIGDDHGAANALNGLGNTYRAQSRNEEAEKALNDAHNIYSRVGDRLGTGNALRSLGMLYSGQCRYNDAEVSYRQALSSYDYACDGGSKAKTLIALGQDCYAQCKYPEAEEAATEALAIGISIGDDPDQAGASLILSQIFRSQSRQNEEKEALIQAEAVLSRLGQDATRAETLDRLGDIHLAQRTFDEAEECYRLAQAIWSSMENVRGEAVELLSLGVLYVRQNRYGAAVECFADARVAYARIVDENGEAKALDGLAGAYALQRQLVDAKVACAEAREMYAHMGRPMSEMCAATWKLLQDLETPIGPLLGGLFLS